MIIIILTMMNKIGIKVMLSMMGGEYHTIIFIGPLLVLLATCILTKIAHFHWRSPLIAFFAGVSLNTQIPVSIEEKKNCANMRQFENATISCDGGTNADKKKTNSHDFSNSYDFSRVQNSEIQNAISQC